MSNELQHEIVPKLRALFVPTVYLYYLDVASATLMVYDYLLTLDMELRVIWGNKRSIPTMLFLTNRYALWLFCLTAVLRDLVQWNSATMCYIVSITTVLITILLVLVIALFLSMRIHAINGRRWFWSCLVFLLASATAPYAFAALLFARFHQYKGTGLPITHGCFVKPSKVLAGQSWIRGVVAVQACTCAANAIAVFITWYRTKDIIFIGLASGVRTSTSLAYSMFRSGLVFFLADLLLNIIQIYFFIRVHATIMTLLVTVESVLMSRFMLSLRAHESDSDEVLEMCTLPDAIQSSNSRTTMLVFDHMAAPLDFWNEDEDGRTYGGGGRSHDQRR